jgi:glycosyltransferase involved in cell wall biosynthesis
VSARASEIAVVVPSHNRPIRLRWLLNALEDQTLERGRFEVVVAHDSGGDETETLLRTHPLARDGTLRHLRFEPSRGAASKLRNAAWRASTAATIVFTDDDCRPPPEWLEHALGAAGDHPAAILQGMTLGDPEEEANGRAPWPHSQRILPPEPWAQTCNIVYPRQVLEEFDGFREEPPLLAGEDTELAARARAAGVEYLGAPDVLTYHAVEDAYLPQRLRSLWRWGDLAMLVKRHPELRDDLPLWIFWKRTHVWLPLAIYGAIRERRNPLFALLAIPWLLHTFPTRGTDPRGRLRSILEMPGRLAIDVTEFIALVRGSIKHRTLFL